MEIGGQLPPCVDAALNLGCVPVRASRSQKHSSPRTYLRPSSYRECSGDASPKVLNEKNANEGNAGLMRPGVVDSTRLVWESNRSMTPNTNQHISSPREKLSSVAIKDGVGLGHNTSLNGGAVYPLYYGMSFECDVSQFSVPKSDPIIVGVPIFSAVAEPAEEGCLQNLFTYPEDKNVARETSEAVYEERKGKRPKMGFDLSLGLGPFSGCGTDTVGLRVSQVEDKEFHSFPMDSAYDLSWLGKRSWEFELQNRNVEVVSSKLEMDRWSGVLEIPLYPNSSTSYRVTASLLLSSSPKNLAKSMKRYLKDYTVFHVRQVPSGNTIFFSGDRVEKTENPVIDKLSDPQKIAEILVSKFGGSINAFVVEASVFNGPFAVYKDFIPSVNEYGEPKSYDATGFPASTSLVLLLSKFLAEAKNVILGKQKEPYQTETSSSFSLSCKPKTALLGFSKGGTVLNQLITEFSFSEIQSTEFPPQSFKNMFNGGVDNWIIPTSKELLFNSIAEIHYVDVGLNTEGAYLTDKDVIDRISELLTRRVLGIRFLFHGTPRQWFDDRRIWIRKEKDALVRLLKGVAHRDMMGKLRLRERLYFPGKSPDLQMHFEIIEVMDVS